MKNKIESILGGEIKAALENCACLGSEGNRVGPAPMETTYVERMQKMLINNITNFVEILKPKQMFSFEDIQKQVEAIMENYPYEESAAIMKFRNHTWRGSSVSPSASEIKIVIATLLTQILDAKKRGAESHSCGTGGFQAYLFPYGIRVSYAIQSKSSF